MQGSLSKSIFIYLICTLLFLSLKEDRIEAKKEFMEQAVVQASVEQKPNVPIIMQPARIPVTIAHDTQAIAKPLIKAKTNVQMWSPPPENKKMLIKPKKPTSLVKSDSGITESQIKAIFKGTLLAEYGIEQAILDVEASYGINAYFTIAVMKLESAHGKSQIAVKKNNLFGLNALDGDGYNQAFSFETKAESVQKFGQLISNSYIGKGYTTIEKVSKKYCLANPEWPDLVKRIMEGDYQKL